MTTASNAAARPVPPPEPAWRRRLRAAVRLGGWVYAAAVVAAWALLWGASDRWWPVTLLLFGPRWALALPLVLLVPLAAWVRRRSLALHGAVLVLVAGPIMNFCVPWCTFLASEPARPPLRVLTCNIHRNTVHPEALGDVIAETMPDVVVLQEYSALHEAEFFWQRDWHRHRDAEELFVASRFPVRRAEALAEMPAWGDGAAAHYELETPDGPLHVFNVHLASPHLALEAVLHERWRGLPLLEANVRDRWAGAEAVRRHAAAVDGPVVLAGDFNTPPESALFRGFGGPYQNAFSVAGWGWGHTYFTHWMSLRIDHVLVGRGWRVRGCRVGPDVGSPHRPVLADLEWTGESD